MAITTRTITVNAAFLQEIKDDHHELRQLMHHTAAMLARPGWMPTEFDRLVDLLTKTRDQLAMHFSLEEAYGYFEDALTAAPHLVKRAEQLRSQHFDLYSDFCGLVERAEQLLYHEKSSAALAGLADGYRVFSLRLQDHETQEGELILQAFNDDIGAGD